MIHIFSECTLDSIASVSYTHLYYRYIDNQLVFAGNKIYVRKGTDQVTGADTLLKACLLYTSRCV